jgi:hypothetical protein
MARYEIPIFQMPATAKIQLYQRWLISITDSVTAEKNPNRLKFQTIRGFHFLYSNTSAKDNLPNSLLLISAPVSSPVIRSVGSDHFVAFKLLDLANAIPPAHPPEG